MANNEILITASLEIPKSTNTIKNDLKIVSAQIDSQKAFKIICNLDLGKTQNRIQSQLNTISKNLSLNIGNISTASIGKTSDGLGNIVSAANKSTESISKVKSSLADLKDEFTTPIKASFTDGLISAEKTIEKVKAKYAELGSVSVKSFYSDENSADGLNKFAVSIKSATGETRTLNYELDKIGKTFYYKGGVGSDVGITKQIETAEVAAKKLQTQLNTIKSSYLDKNVSKPIKNDSSISDLNAQYNKVTASIESLASVDSASFKKMKANVESEIQSLKNLVTQYQNAEYVATSLRTKDFSTVKSEEKNKLKQFETSIRDSKVSFADMQKDISSLNTSLNESFNKSSLTEYLNQLSVAKSKFESLNEQAKSLANINNTINKKINLLNPLSGNSTFKKNANNPDVISFKAKVDSLKASYIELQKLTSTAKTPQDFILVQDSLNKLNLEFNEATKNAKEFQTALRDNSGIDALSSKITKAKNDIKSYVDANSKAMSKISPTANISYRELLSNYSSQFTDGIDIDTFNKLTAKVKTVKSEIKALGYEGSTSIQSLWANIKKFSSWMGMTTVIAGFARSVSKAVDELKEMDTILTEISKTSDRTEKSLQKLGENSFDDASKYGKKASDYLTGVQEMSRAGFGEKESETMAQLSVLAQSAGDMTSELANSYLLATDSAYKFKGSSEKLNSVLDSQNFITNHNALNMSELAEATKIAGSQAAQAGIGIDEATAAMGTMIASTKQGGEIAARAFKGIIMNLQQVKASAEDIGDGDGDITSESLSKYEKACEDLGVSLKELKNGVWVLRDPMQTLNDLAIQFNKEADNSIKKANLINAVGGKYRGNQLSALLDNWDKYQKMLGEFNSQEAIGSSLEEAMKSANSWEGRLNSLSNTWTEFVQNFVNTDFVKGSIKTLDNLISLLDKLINQVGVLPTLLAPVGVILGAKNVGELQTCHLIHRYIKCIGQTHLK